MRAILLFLHKWIGLGSSVILMIVGVTGALLVLPATSAPVRLAGALHDTLGVGRVGWIIVLAATAAAVALQLSGIVLWWRRKSVKVRTDAGWRLFAFDLHHAVGAIGLVLMLVIAGSALGRVALRTVGPGDPALGQAVSRLHTTRGYSAPVKAVFFAGSLCFAVQGMTGVAMWWKRR